MDFIDLFYIAKNDKDDILLIELLNKLEYLKKLLLDTESNIFFTCSDNVNVFFDIQVGSGGLDAQDWVNILFKMYISWFEKREFKYKIISLISGELSGIKFISIKISGKFAYGWLKYESGIHRLVRKSPFDTNKKRHTSFASVFIYPDNEVVADININESDLKIDTFRSSGAGGQHVNTTDSAVRIKHISSGIVVQCQSERSQHQNKLHALRQLMLKLRALHILNCKLDKQKLEKNKLSITWGNQIRSYVLDKSFIKDLRSGYETSNVELVLNGNLDIFVLSVLNMKEKKI